MSGDGEMTLVGKVGDRVWYWADHRFARPGLYFWDGKANIHIEDFIRAIQSDAARSERERAARVCDAGSVAEWDTAGQAAKAIRALPDSSAGEASGKAEGET